MKNNEAQARLPIGLIDPRVGNCMTGIGILAYGSLISDPGTEIDPLIVRRIKTTTPFPVEYARYSKSRGGAPTVVPFTFGEIVKAEVLVLSDKVTLDEAKDLLWRRETRNEGSGRTYKESSSQNAVLVCDVPNFCGLGHALYTDFNDNGKISRPDVIGLTKAAIASVGKAELGKDGISYLIALIKAEVKTALTPGYVAQILALTRCASLEDALVQVKNIIGGGAHDGQS